MAVPKLGSIVSEVARKRHNLLVLSDVHLGSDLVHHARPEAPPRARASEQRRQDLTRFFEFYRDHRHQGRRWRLIIAGDFIDFAGMSVLPDETYDTAPTREELAHGLGGAADHTLAKLRLVLEHESSLMKSLAEFIAGGNSVVIVRGNHDVDWHWEAVQEEFRRGLSHHARVPRKRLTFMPWFYYEEGRVFIEHGHQYDALCSYDHLLHPVSPWDRRRTVRSISDILLRYVVRPTRGMTEAGHDAAGISDYLRFAFGLGMTGMLALLRRFVGATRALIDLWREHLSEAAEWVHREHERKMAALGRLHRIRIERLRELVGLQKPPITRSLLAILSTVMLDQVLLAFSGALIVALLLLLVPSRGWAWGSSAAALSSVFVIGVVWRRSRHSLEPSAELRERAALVARLFPAAFIVMGHTHLPETQTSADTTYINLGTWAEDEVEEGRLPTLPSTRTHLVVAYSEDRPIAELLTWNGSAPRPFGEGQVSQIVDFIRRRPA